MGLGIVGWIVLGLIVGLIAKAIMPGKDPGGIIITALIGIVGGLLGGFIGRSLFHIQFNGFWSFKTWIWAIIGSVILLLIYRLVFHRKSDVNA